MMSRKKVLNPYERYNFEEHTRHPGSVWLQKHFDAVKRTYPGQWVAVDGRGVRAAGSSPEETQANFLKRYALKDFDKLLVQLIP